MTDEHSATSDETLDCKPWWCLTRTMKQSAVIGGPLTAIGVIGLVVCFLVGGRIWYLFFSLSWLVSGSLYLASSAARHRHAAAAWYGVSAPLRRGDRGEG